MAHTRQIKQACKLQNHDLMAQLCDSAKLAADHAKAEIQKNKKKLGAAKVTPLLDIILMALVAQMHS